MEISPVEISWMKLFFSPPNDIHWGDFNSAKVDAHLRDELIAWVSSFGAQNCEIVLLPCLTAGTTIWYACSPDPQTMAQVREEMEALVANSYADLEAYPAVDPLNPSEIALQQRFGANICKIIPYQGNESFVLRRFEMYRQLTSRRPKRNRVGARPVGKIRFDFDKAILAGQYDDASAHIEEMRTTGRLSLENQRFLEIRLLAAQEKWQQIVADPTYLRSVVDLPLPKRILADLVESVYQVYLHKYEIAQDPVGVVESFKIDVLPKYGRLFRARKGLTTPSALKAFLLDQLSSDAPEAAICQELVNAYPVDCPGYNFIHALMGGLPKHAPTKEKIERAKEAFDDDKIEQALRLFVSCTPDQEVLARVLRCSRELETLTDLEIAWDFCQKCPATWIEELTGKQRKDYDGLKETFSKKPIGNWIEWTEFVLEGGDQAQADEIARSGADEWSLNELFAIPDGVERLCRLLSDGVNDYPDFFQAQFPKIYEFTESFGRPNAQLRPLYIALLEMLACSDTVGESDLILAQELIESLFEVGVSPEAYQNILETVELFWATAKSFKYLDWALDMAELLAISPSPKPNLRAQFFNNVLSLVATNSQRIEPSTWMVLELLGQDYDAVDFVGQLRPADREVEAFEGKNPLAGKKVGIYSLTEPAAIRARQILEGMFPGVRVEVNHDHEATPALENLAKSSDLFVFAWRSSKHQAYYCVKKYVKEEKLILPKGKGSSSIISCITDMI